jgi:putative nucleotidyltransferase with HDIG domain
MFLAHSVRVATYAAWTAQALGLSARQVELVGLAGLFHDVGKALVPPRILLKPTPLSAADWNAVRTHCQMGYEILGRFDGFYHIAEMVLHHHERYGGNGYPIRLSGEAIPVGARIISVADAFDAMTCTRPYRERFHTDRVCREIACCLDTQFDPEVARVFLTSLV